MSDKEVIYCVDTNLLVEFVPLDTVPWRELNSGIAEVRIIIPTKVGEEMDEHKNKSGRLRRRAIEFGQLSRRIEDSSDGVVVLRAANPRVSVEFGPLFRKSDLDGDQFDLDDSDNRVVAEVAAITHKVPGATLLADDSKPIRLARQAGIPYTRPLGQWRRQEGPDERDVEITELKREIGAYPHLKVSLTGAEGADHRQVLLPAPEQTDFACSEAFRTAVFQVDPQVTRDRLIKKHGYYNPGRFDIPLGVFGGQGLTEDQLQRYQKAYDQFSEKVYKISEKLSRCFDFYGVALPITVIAGNSGDRAADRVQVTAELDGPFRFLPTDKVAKALKSLIDPPKPPEQSRYDLSALTRNLSAIDREVRRPDMFYEQDEPSSDGESKLLSWRCEELRQLESHELNLLVATEAENAAGLLTIWIGSATIAKSTVLRAPLSCGPPPAVADRDFFIPRLRHIPRRYRKVFRTLLGQI